MSGLELDLHEIKHADVSAVLIQIIEEHRGDPIMLRIITGNSDRMKQIVKCILLEYGYYCSDILPTELTTWIK